MTKITFFKRDGVYYGFRESGHAGYGESGNDIICSALSAMTMLIINTAELAYSAKVDYIIDEEKADITVRCMAALPDFAPDQQTQHAVAGLFKGYYYQINDLLEEYYDYIEVDEVEE